MVGYNMEDMDIDIIRLIEASHDPDSIRGRQVDKIMRKTDGSILIIWKPRRWILTDFELIRRFGNEWFKNATIKK